MGNYEKVCNYFFLCNSTFSFGFEMQTANSIISGNIITDLLKPLSYRSLTFFKAVGTAGMEFLITFLWCGTFLVMCNGMQNIEMWRVLLLLFSILLGMGIKFNIQYIFSMLCFYTDNAYGVVKGREVLTNFCSGALVPLALFPGFLQKIVMIMPFSGIVYIPCSIFDGIFAGRNVGSTSVPERVECNIICIWKHLMEKSLFRYRIIWRLKMGRYRKYFKIYRKMQEMNIKSLMYYRADFLMMTFLHCCPRYQIWQLLELSIQIFPQLAAGLYGKFYCYTDICYFQKDG